MKSTNYYNTFIATAEHSLLRKGTIPPVRKPSTIAWITCDLLTKNPYRYTSDELLWEIYLRRNSDPKRSDFEKINQACMRCSPLPKRYGWGIHFDQEGRMALWGIESSEYQNFLDDGDLRVVRVFEKKT